MVAALGGTACVTQRKHAAAALRGTLCVPEDVFDVAHGARHRLFTPCQQALLCFLERTEPEAADLRALDARVPFLVRQRDRRTHVLLRRHLSLPELDDNVEKTLTAHSHSHIVSRCLSTRCPRVRSTTASRTMQTGVNMPISPGSVCAVHARTPAAHTATGQTRNCVSCMVLRIVENCGAQCAVFVRPISSSRV